MTTGNVLVRAIAWAAVAVGVCIPQVPQMQSVTAPSTLSGRVVAGDTGAPVRGAMVTLTAQAGPPTTAVSDGDGRFQFSDLPPGRYLLGITKNGFPSTFFSLAGPSNEHFEIRQGQRIADVELRLPKAGVIAGRVLDAHGDAASDVRVTAWRLEYSAPGEKRLQSVRSTQTNDLGDYRLFGLTAGKYYVSAGAPPPLRAPGEPLPILNYAAGAALALTFYPDTARAADAQPVIVRNNAEAAGTNLRLQPLGFTRIRGLVRDSTGRPASDAYVMFNPERPDGAMYTLGAAGTETDPTGSFVIPDVPPGEYRIDVMPKARLRDPAAGSASFIRMLPAGETASVSVTVSGERVIDLDVTLGAGRRISGRVLIDDQPPPAGIAAGLVVTASPLVRAGPSTMFQTIGSPVNPDGMFTIFGVLGARLIRVSASREANASILRIVVAGVDVTDRGINVDQTDVNNVEIRMTTKQTLVSGTVTDGSGAPAGQAAVIVFPDDRSLWTLPQNRWIKGVPVSDDHFGIPNLPPGRYLAAVVTTLERGAWAEPDHLEQLRPSATPFTLSEGEKLKLALVKR